MFVVTCWVFKINHLFWSFLWSFNNYFVHAFAMKKSLKQWNLGIKRCSNCCNCFIIFLTFVCCIQVKNQMWRVYFHTLSLFPLQMRYHYWFAFHVNTIGLFTLTEKHKFESTHQPMKQSQESNSWHKLFVKFVMNDVVLHIMLFLTISL